MVSRTHSVTPAPNNAVRTGQLFAQLSRPQNVLYSGILAASVYIACGGRSLATVALLYAMLFLLYAAAAAINNLYDVRADTLNKRSDNPLTTSTVTYRQLRTFSIMCFVLSAIAALALGLWACAAWLAYILLLMAYSIPPIQLKARALFGTTALALCYSGLPIFLGLTQQQMIGWHEVQIAGIMVLLSIPGLLAKDYKDESGDRQTGIRTPLVVYGPQVLRRLAGAVIGVASLLTIVVAPSLSVAGCLVLLAICTSRMHRAQRSPAWQLRIAQLMLVLLAVQLTWAR